MTYLLLEAESVTKSFDGVPALKDGRFQLRPGSVHALCGGNGAGKSTFLSVIMGLLSRDGGTVKVRGEEVNFRDPTEALKARIAIITQELSPVPEMTVAENIFLGRELVVGGVCVQFGQMEAAAERIIKDIGFDLDPKAKMASLSLAQTQLVEITRALSMDAEIIIMDEPTSAIGEHETHVLFDAIRRVTAKGVGIIYVSHRLEELFEIADSYTVFRDGRFIEDGKLADIDREQLVRLIVGHELVVHQRDRKAKAGEAILSVKDLTVGSVVNGISIDLFPGEVVGLYGLMGAGRSEFLSAIYGIGRRDGGEVQLAGRPLPPRSPSKAIARGVAMITEDRKETGLVLPASIRHNISLSILSKLSRFSVVSASLESGVTSSLFSKLRVKAASANLPVQALSGGNQQKVVVARCLSSKPRVLICDEPTRGIDEGAKQEIYDILDGFVSEGGAVIMASSEAPELLQNCDRIAVFKKGRLVKMLLREEASQHSLLTAAS